MNKEQFLAALRARLTALPKDDLEKTLQYYREMIEDRVEDGMTEFEAVDDVGDPAELAEAILQKPVKQTAVRAPKAPKQRRPMSAGKKAALIVAACLLICAGVGIILASLNMGRSSAMEKEVTLSEDIRALEIDSGSAAVELLCAKDGATHVKYIQSARVNYDIEVDGGTLRVARRRAGGWSLFSVSLAEDYVRVYLPEREYESLWIKSSSGGVAVPEDFRFGSAVINASSGGIAFAADAREELNIQTSSGGVAVSGASPARLVVSASSGGVALADMHPGSVSLNLSSGSLRLSAIRCADLDAESSSGSVRLSDVIATGKITLDCSSGSIRLDDCDAAALDLHCSSGSISGHLLTDKDYRLSSTSGSVYAPSSSAPTADGEKGICQARTTSGSIRFD
ncbi:MAG: DUF1700 domain-containing protein [Ruminococcaceae bacterium]|nr:DUF1700 domain-containing protein [Oscillospiraceae bacterium]